MSKPLLLAIGATGSIGRHVVKEALIRGFFVRALVREPARAQFPDTVEIVAGDLTRPETLLPAVAGVDAIVFTHGSGGGGKAGSQAVDYGGVRNVLFSLGVQKPRVALMTAIGVTNRTGSYNKSTEAHDWKRRGERLVRASGLDYTIIRPGWFDYNDRDQLKLDLLQGDMRQSGTPRDGVVSRQQIAEMLVWSLTSTAARRKTFELVAEKGAAPANPDRLLAALAPDPPGALDGVGDVNNMPLSEEPETVLSDLERLDLVGHVS